MPDLHEEIRQAAAILAKNLAVERWESKLSTIPTLGEDEKAFVRANILEAIAASSRVVQFVPPAPCRRKLRVW
jgi:hypothetical protein